jgi:ABC-2 type transport system ATP-binding protein
MEDSAPYAVRCSDLTKDYGTGRGVFDLDLTVEVGEVFGFLGPNGAARPPRSG